LKKLSVTQAVLEAVRDELTREKKRRSRKNLADALIAIGRRWAARMGPGISSADHALLYDENGLPR
jgi:hypothetical protein